MKTRKTLFAVIALVSLTACESAPQAVHLARVQESPEIVEAAPEAPAEIVTPVAAVTPTPAVTPVSIALTYYKLTATRAPVNGWSTKTYVSTGSCVVYQANTYCWDDGIKTLSWSSGGHSYGPYGYSYWNIGIWNVSQPWSHTSGTLIQDLMAVPTLVTHNLETRMDAGSVNTVLTMGTQVSVTCTEADGVLSCIDFTIDLNQAHL